MVNRSSKTSNVYTTHRTNTNNGISNSISKSLKLALLAASIFPNTTSARLNHPPKRNLLTPSSSPIFNKQNILNNTSSLDTIDFKSPRSIPLSMDNPMLSSGSGSVVIAYDANQTIPFSIENGELKLLDSALTLASPAHKITVDGDQALVLDSENSLTLYHINSSKQFEKLSSIDISDYFTDVTLEPKEIAMEGNLAVVAGRQNNLMNGIVIFEHNNNQLEVIQEAAIGDSTQDSIITELDIKADRVVVSNSAVTTAVLITRDLDAPSQTLSTNSGSLTKNPVNICIGRCVDSLLIGDRYFIASDSALKILDIPANKEAFLTKGEINPLATIPNGDGAKILGIEQLNEDTLVMLKHFDKLTFVNITDATVLDTVSINALKENNFTKIALVENSDGNKVVTYGSGNEATRQQLDRTKEPSLYAFTQFKDSDSTKSKKSPETATKHIDLSPYIEEKTVKSSASGYINAFISSIVLTTLPKLITAILPNESATGPIGVFNPYQGFTTSNRNVPANSVIKMVDPIAGFAVSSLAGLREALLMNRVGDVEAKTYDLMNTVAGMGKFITSDDGLGPIIEDATDALIETKDWNIKFLKMLAEPEATGSKVMESLGVDVFLTDLKAELLKRVQISDYLDNADLITKLPNKPNELDLDDLVSILTNSLVIKALGFEGTGYDGKKIDASQNEKFIGALLNHFVRSTTNGRVPETMISNFMEATRTVIEKNIDQMIKKQNAIHEIGNKLTTAIRIIEQELVPLIPDEIDKASEALKLIKRGASKLGHPGMVTLINTGIGWLGASIAETLVRNMHSTATLCAERLPTQRIPSFLQNIVIQNSYDRVMDSASLGIGLTAGLAVEEGILRPSENDISDGIKIASTILKDLAFFIDNGVEVGDHLSDAVKKTVNLLKETMGEVGLHDYVDAIQNQIESGELFVSDANALNTKYMGPTIAFITERAITDNLQNTTDPVFDKAKEIIDRVTENISFELFDKQLNQLNDALPYVKAFIKRTTNELNHLAESVDELGDTINGGWSFIENAAILLLTAYLITRVLTPAKELIQAINQPHNQPEEMGDDMNENSRNSASDLAYSDNSYQSNQSFSVEGSNHLEDDIEMLGLTSNRTRRTKSYSYSYPMDIYEDNFELPNLSDINYEIS